MNGPQNAAQLSRRRFLQRAGVVAGVGTIAPFTFIPTAAAGAGLDRFIKRKVREAGTMGISAAVVRGNEVVWSGGYGWADKEGGIPASPDTVWMQASVSKTVTCAGVMALVEDGSLDLDADVNDYLPFDVRIPAAPSAPITLRQLLTHTSAIRDRWSVWGGIYSPGTLYSAGDSPISLYDFLEDYLVPGMPEYQSSNFYDRMPGDKYSYSNIAVDVAALVAQTVGGTDFNELCKSRILTPLGITDAGFKLADIGTPDLAMPYRYHNDTGDFDPYFQYGYPDYPCGALRVSAPNLARWLGAFTRFGIFQGVRVLDEATVREIRKNQLKGLVYWPQGLIWYGETHQGYPVMGHTGGDYGVSTRMFFRTDKQIGVCTMTNTYLGGRRWSAFRDVERELFDRFG